MAVSHVKTDIQADFTGTVTVFNSQGSTQTVNATDIVRPSDWNSVHNQYMTLAGNTAGASTLSGTNLVMQGGNNVTLSANGQTLIFSGGPGVVPSAGTQTATSGTVVFSNSNGISFGMSGSSQITASYTVPPAQTGISAIQVSDSTFTSGTIVFQNANGLSFGSSGANGVSASYTVPTQTAQTLGVYASSNTTGQSSSSTVDARSLSFIGKGVASVGLSAGQVVISVPSGGGGGLSAGLSTDGNTAGTTGAVSNQLVFVGSGAISLSQSVNGASATLSILGPALTSLSVTGALSASSNGSTISLGVGTVTGYATSNTTQASSATFDLGSMVFRGLGGVSAGLSAGSIYISGPTTTAFSAGVSGGNTSGDTGTKTNQVVFAGGNNITLSGSTNAGGMTVTISGANAGGAQTGISGIVVSNTTYTSGTVSFSNANGISFGSSAGQAITASYTVPTQTNQTLGIYGVSNTTQSSSGTLDARSLSFQGNGAFSVGYSNGSVVLSAPNLTSLSATGALSASSNGNTISLGVGTVTVSATSNTTQASSGTVNLNALIIQGAGGLSAGISNGSIVLSGATGGAGGGIGGLAAGTQTATSGTVVFSDSNGISFGMSGSTRVTASYTVPTQTNQSLGIYASSQTFGQSSSSTYDARSLSVVGSGGVSVGWSNSSLLISGQTTVAQTNQTLGIYNSSQTTGASSSSTHDARSLSIVYSGNISGGWTNGSLLFNVTTAAQTNQTGGIYVTAQSTGQSSSSTYDLRTLSFVPDGIISAGWSNGSFRVSATQSNQAFSAAGGSSAFQTLSFGDTNGVSFTNTNGSVGIASVKLSMFAVSNTTQSSSGTANHSALSFGGAGIASVGVTGGSIVISVPSGGGGGIAASISGNSTSGGAGYSNITSGTMILAGGPNITLSQDGSRISISAPNPGAAVESNAFNLLGANTAGNTTATGSTIGLSGLNLTLSGTNASQIVFSAPATSSLVGWRGIEISTNGATISIGDQMRSFYGNMDGEWPNSTTMQMLQSTSHIQPFVIEAPISFDFLRIPMSASFPASTTAATTGNTQFSYGHSRSHNFALYSRGTGASSQSLQLVASTQLTDRQSMNISANANSTQFSYTNRASYQMSTGEVGFTFDYSSSAASLNYHTSQMTAISGLKVMEFPWATSLAPGQYWLMYGVSSNTASQFTNVGTRWFNIFSNYGMSMPNLQFGTIGAATNNSVGPFLGQGSFTTAGGGSTTSLGFSNVTTSSAHNKMFFQMVRIV